MKNDILNRLLIHNSIYFLNASLAVQIMQEETQIFLAVSEGSGDGREAPRDFSMCKHFSRGCLEPLSFDSDKIVIFLLRHSHRLEWPKRFCDS